MPRRSLVIVLDGCGAGFAPDAEAYGDVDQPNTLRHTWDHVGGIDAPHLIELGFFASAGIDAAPGSRATYGRLRPLSQGKDSVTGHWEMMGIVLDQPFPTYPDGFPIPLVKAFERAIGTQTLGNCAASGTEIIQRLGPLHVETGFPILYTSADSVFQIATHESIVPIEQLYEWCRIARELCRAPNDVQRVIARPFTGDAASGFTRTDRRKDYPDPAPENLIDRLAARRPVFGIGVVPELFAGRGFREVRRTQSNDEHAAMLLGEGLASDAEFIFANFEDTDMRFGHRNDPDGFARCLEAFDRTLGDLLARLTSDDQLILTADHGNDPTDVSTDHTREYAPLAALNWGTQGPLGDLEGYASVGHAVSAWLGA